MLVLSSAKDGEEEDEAQQDCENEERDFPNTIWTITLHFSRSTVDDYLIDFLVQPVRARVNGQQQVLEGDGRIVCGDVMNALLVAAYVAAHVAVNHAGRSLLGVLEAFGQFDLIALRLEA